MRSITWALSLVAAASLIACGGGGGTSPGTTPGAMTFAGTAAQGAAIAGGTVDVKCAAGSGQVTTGADGKYSITLEQATLPCAFRVTAADGTTYHSVQAGTSTSGNFSVNITPLTELLVARLAGAEPQGFFDAFSSASAVSADAVAQAVAALKAALAGLVDLSDTDPVSDALQAANGSAPGNALDQKLDALAGVMAAAGITLADVTTAIAANPTVPEGINQVLQPPAAACKRLHSGKYRMINPYESEAEWQAHVLTIDAAALTYTDHTGATGSVVSDGAESCSFTGTDSDGTTNKIMVSASGILVVYSTDSGGGHSVAIGLPEQTVPMAELAGTWNTLWFGQSDPNVAGSVVEPGVITFDATGQMTASSICIGLAPCSDEAGPLPKLAARGDGGFDIAAAGVAHGRMHAFKAPNNTFVAVAFGGDGSFLVATKQHAITALPEVGSVNKVWDLTVNGDGSIAPLSQFSLTVTAVDASAKSFSRLRDSDNRLDTMTDNLPRDGMRYRAANSCTVNGAPRNCAATTVLPLQGLGLTVSGSVSTASANSFYGVTIVKP